MNDSQRQQIRKLRADGYSYGKVAQALGLSENTIKTFCRRNGLGGVVEVPMSVDLDRHYCLYCGVEVKQNPGRKKKKFCSDKCRNVWWNSNLDKVNRKAVYSFECLTCKRPFTAYGNAKRKYCCLECYANRNKGGSA